MKKTIILLALLTSSLSIAQKQIQNFDQLLEALKNGKSVKTVIYYGKCKLFSEGKEEEKSPDAIGGMRFDTYEYFDSSVFKGRVPSFVTTSQTILIKHPNYGYVYNYVKIKVRKDNTIEITAQYLKPRWLSKKYKVIMDEIFKGTINDGTNDGSVSFYVE
jgi:hypothetical protein